MRGGEDGNVSKEKCDENCEKMDKDGTLSRDGGYENLQACKDDCNKSK